MTTSDPVTKLPFACGVCATRLTDATALLTSCGHLFCTARARPCTSLQPGLSVGNCDQCGKLCDLGLLTNRAHGYDIHVQTFLFTKVSEKLRELANVLDYRHDHHERLFQLISTRNHTFEQTRHDLQQLQKLNHHLTNENNVLSKDNHRLRTTNATLTTQLRQLQQTHPQHLHAHHQMPPPPAASQAMSTTRVDAQPRDEEAHRQNDALRTQLAAARHQLEAMRARLHPPTSDAATPHATPVALHRTSRQVPTRVARATRPSPAASPFPKPSRHAGARARGGAGPSFGVPGSLAASTGGVSKRARRHDAGGGGGEVGGSTSRMTVVAGSLSGFASGRSTQVAFGRMRHGSTITGDRGDEGVRARETAREEERSHGWRRFPTGAAPSVSVQRLTQTKRAKQRGVNPIGPRR